MLEKSKSENILLVWGVGVVFLFSIYLRSTIDIGGDTGIYLNLGKKFFLGQKYYCDFFESNFPLSFYIYALEYFLADSLGINVILFSEIVINLFGLLSIICSAILLRRSNLYSDRILYSCLILSFAFGYFIRPLVLNIGEFGTKTSFLMMLLFPYISYSLLGNLTKKDLCIKGLIMGLMGCLKPHYLVFILVVEGYFFVRTKNIKLLFSVDKLLMVLVGFSYLLWMIKYTPEFFEFVVPMWPKIYGAYDNVSIFMDNIFQHLPSRIGVIALVLLIFSRIKIDQEDVIFILFFIASSIVLMLENVSTLDQASLFYVMSTILVVRCGVKFVRSKKFEIDGNKFMLGLLFLIPFFDLDILPAAFFGFDGIINAWWLVIPIFVLLEIKNKDKDIKDLAIKMIFLAVGLFFCALLVLIYFGPWVYLTFNIASIFLVVWLLEVKLFSKISNYYSRILVFFVLFVFSFVFFSYVKSVEFVLRGERNHTKDFYAYYLKAYASKENESLAMLTRWNDQHYPISNYLGKDNIFKFHVLKADASYSKNGSPLMFERDDLVRNFTYNYLFDDVRKAIFDENVKVLILNVGREMMEGDESCKIHPIEFYFMDSEIREKFFDNFDFENRVMILDKKKVYNSVAKELQEVNNIQNDYEIYVRKDEK
ncbi:MAG: hypothetical protein ISQ34_05845 [Rickettsiales bacterium]|nr:hypothetical protein [Rickettsiales bacterium]